MSAPAVTPAGPPALSVILPTRGRFASIRTTFLHLQRQTVAERIELVVVAPDERDFGLPVSTRLHSVQLVATGERVSVPSAYAQGVRRAQGAIVAFSEDHAFPAPTWAEALIARHAEGWVAVGPVVHNGNPRTAVSWADYLLGYGPWHDARPGGAVAMLPGHNCSYKRDALLRFEPDLQPWLTAEFVLQERLMRDGGRLYLEDRARIRHLNFARPGVFLPVQFHSGRQFAACRTRQWPGWRRIVYAGGSPLIPIVRLWRTLRLGVRFPAQPSRWRILTVLLAGLVADGIGQFAGYLIGAGSSEKFLADYEYDRVRFITSEDRAAVEAE